MPSFPIVDAHVHLWNPSKYRIPWLDGIPSLNRPLELDAYDQALTGTAVESIVYLQVEVAPPYSLLEARDIVALGETDPRVRGVVAWAPLEFGEQVRYYLDELVKLGNRIKGVRRIVQDEPDPDFSLQPGFIRGTQLLGEYGLSSDLCCKFHQMAQQVELVRRCPQTQFILDHIGKPNIRDGQFEPWVSHIRALAALPNVVCKISGVVTEADLAGWTVEDVKPFVLHALEHFGEDRVVFGSDWPVVTLAATHNRWVETLDALTSDWSETAKRKLWSGNAMRFYRL